jgi:hypothetical protein
MRRAERLVQVEVDDVVSHVARTSHAHQGVEIGSIHVHQGADLVHQLRDLEDVGLEHSQRVRVGEHQPGHRIVEVLPQGLEVHPTGGIGWDFLGVETGHRRRCRVGSVRRVREQDAPARASLSVRVVVRPHQQYARHLTLRSGCRLQRHLVHPGDFLQHLGQLVHQSQSALGARLRRERVQTREARHATRRLVHLGIVLHGARPKRVQGAVHVVILERQLGVVTHHLVLRDLRETSRLVAQVVSRYEVAEWQRVHVRAGHPCAAPSRLGLLEYGGRRLALEWKAGHRLPLLRQNS